MFELKFAITKNKSVSSQAVGALALVYAVDNIDTGVYTASIG